MPRHMFTAPTTLPDDPPTLQLISRAALAEIERLQLQLASLRRNRFGRRSEQLDDATLRQGEEDLEQSVAEQQAALDAALPPGDASPPEPDAAPGKAPRAKPAKRNRGALPENLPRVEVIVDIDDKACPCCGGTLHVIGEDCAEMLDYIPAQFRVRVIRRPRYGCRGCAEAVVQAPAPDRPIDGGLATEALLAHVLISKYGDHLPLYRQAQIFARQGMMLDRSTLCDWVGRACWWLTPLYERILSAVLASPKVFADDTTLPVLDPGQGKTKTGRLWCYAIDDRPWRGAGHPAAAYVYSEDRKGEHPATHLKRFRGLLWIGEILPRTTRQVGAWIERECGVDYQSRSGLITLLHRLGMEHRKPKAISRKLDPAKQEAFIKAYNALLNGLSADEAIVFADAVHPTHAARPVGCWAPKEVAVAVEQSSGRDRLNIHGAIDLETGQTIMKDVLSVDALSTILLLTAIETLYRACG